MDFLKSALAAIPSAATSPAAFVAYLAALLAFVYTQHRVARNKQLLANLQKLPVQKVILDEFVPRSESESAKLLGSPR